MLINCFLLVICLFVTVPAEKCESYKSPYTVHEVDQVIIASTDCLIDGLIADYIPSLVLRT